MNLKSWSRLKRAQRDEAQANSAKIAGQRATRLAAISDRESELRRVRDSLGELQDRRAQGQVRESQFQMKIDNLLAHISRSYQIDLRSFTPDEAAFEKTLRAQVKRNEKLEGGASATPDSPELAPPNLEKVIADLRTQLDNMGPVNLEAVHEYDELEERYKFLDAQNTDLTNSQRELLDVIARINSTTRKLFADTFEQVRTNFREMFGGAIPWRARGLVTGGRERPAELRHRNHGQAAGETIAKRVAVERR